MGNIDLGLALSFSQQPSLLPPLPSYPSTLPFFLELLCFVVLACFNAWLFAIIDTAFRVATTLLLSSLFVSVLHHCFPWALLHSSVSQGYLLQHGRHFSISEHGRKRSIIRCMTGKQGGGINQRFGKAAMRRRRAKLSLFPLRTRQIC